MNNLYVTDGKEIFDQYFFDQNRQLHSHGRHGFCKFQNYTGSELVTLWKDGKFYCRSLQKLRRWSCPSTKLKKLLSRVKRYFVPVFGFEDKYMFNPNNPLEVFNIEKRHLKTILKSKKYYMVAIKINNDQNLLIHQMIMQHYFQKHIDTDRFDIHHLNHNSFDNRLKNLIVLPKNVHCTFEGYWKYYKNKNPKKNKYSKKNMVDLINGFDISIEDKRRLINNL